jgi:hypothetical protein
MYVLINNNNYSCTHKFRESSPSISFELSSEVDISSSAVAVLEEVEGALDGYGGHPESVLS